MKGETEWMTKRIKPAGKWMDRWMEVLDKCNYKIKSGISNICLFF